MKQNYSLTEKLRSTFAGVSLFVAAGCAQHGLISETDFQRTSVSYKTPNSVKGHELRRATEKDAKYNLERVVIKENDLYVENNRFRNEGELDFYFTKFEDHHKQMDNSTNETRTTSDFIYIPTQFKVTVDEGGKKVEKPAKKMSLSTQGKYGIKADITRYDTRNIDAGIIREDQSDTKFNIKTQFIKGQEWYVPVVEESQIANPDALPFYMASVVRSVKDIDALGNVTLISEGGVFRAIKMSRKDYEARAQGAPSEKSKTDGNIGQSVSPSS